jgi:hypothetical protein
MWWNECETSLNLRGIYRTMDFEIFSNFFWFFGALTVKTASFSVQTIKFKFKRTNQEVTRHYCLSILAVGDSADG